MEGTVTGRGIEIKWTADNPKQASSGASECFQRNVMTKHHRKDCPMRKMIGKSRGRAEKSGGGRGRKDNVGIGGCRLWQAYQRPQWELGTRWYGPRLSVGCRFLRGQPTCSSPLSSRCGVGSRSTAGESWTGGWAGHAVACHALLCPVDNG
jgi:hypothetical protein